MVALSLLSFAPPTSGNPSSEKRRGRDSGGVVVVPKAGIVIARMLGQVAPLASL